MWMGSNNCWYSTIGYEQQNLMADGSSIFRLKKNWKLTPMTPDVNNSHIRSTTLLVLNKTSRSFVSYDLYCIGKAGDRSRAFNMFLHFVTMTLIDLWPFDVQEIRQWIAGICPIAEMVTNTFDDDIKTYDRYIGILNYGYTDPSAKAFLLKK